MGLHSIVLIPILQMVGFGWALASLAIGDSLLSSSLNTGGARSAAITTNTEFSPAAAPFPSGPMAAQALPLQQLPPALAPASTAFGQSSSFVIADPGLPPGSDDGDATMPGLRQEKEITPSNGDPSMAAAAVGSGDSSAAKGVRRQYLPAGRTLLSPVADAVGLSGMGFAVASPAGAPPPGKLGVCPSGGPSLPVECDPKRPWPQCPPQSYCYATNTVDIGPYFCCPIWSTYGAAWRPASPFYAYAPPPPPNWPEVMRTAVGAWPGGFPPLKKNHVAAKSVAAAVVKQQKAAVQKRDNDGVESSSSVAPPPPPPPPTNTAHDDPATVAAETAGAVDKRQQPAASDEQRKILALVQDWVDRQREEAAAEQEQQIAAQQQLGGGGRFDLGGTGGVMHAMPVPMPMTAAQLDPMDTDSPSFIDIGREQELADAAQQQRAQQQQAAMMAAQQLQLQQDQQQMDGAAGFDGGAGGGIMEGAIPLEEAILPAEMPKLPMEGARNGREERK